jgi:hypothetical protein
LARLLNDSLVKRSCDLEQGMWVSDAIAGEPDRRPNRIPSQACIDMGKGRPEAELEVADDDILDAFAALWTAERIAPGEAVTLPEVPPRDRHGLPMEMVA